MEKKDRKCSLCGLLFYGYGHNPEPLKCFEDRCCDDCNWMHVIPARLYKWHDTLGKQAQRDDETAKGDGH